MDAFWEKLDAKSRALLAGDAEQSGRLEAAAQAAAGATGEAVGACPSNTPPLSSQLMVPDFPELKSTCGIDWLEYGGILSWTKAAFEGVTEQLEEAKRRAQETEQNEVRILLNGCEAVYVQRIGMKRGKFGGTFFDYRFVHKGINISMTRKHAPSDVVVMLRGKDCLLHGAFEAHAVVNELFTRLGAGAIQGEKLSRIDLRQDVTGLPVATFRPLIDERCFVSRARYVHAWDNRATDTWTGLTVGKHPRELRIYDKKQEQSRKYDAEIYRALVDRCWGGTDPEHATRIEFQLGRTFLKKYAIHSLSDLRANLGSLLAQLTTDFWRFTTEPVKSADKHQSRAEVHPLWSALGRVWLEYAQAPVGKLAAIRYDRVEPRKLMAMAIGCLVSVMLQRKFVFTTIAQFAQIVAEMIREHLKDETVGRKFLTTYWQRFKDKPYDFPNAA